MILVAVAYLLIFAMITAIYGLSSSLRICMTPFASALLAAAVLGLSGAPFNLFAVFGLILTMGIGIDYTLFLHNRSSAVDTTFLAVVLSFFSTLLSFGALSFSSFAPVADFGRSVLWGVLFSFLLAPFSLHRR